MIPVVIGKTIWDELPPSNVDTQKLEHLFESRAKDLMTKVSVFLQLKKGTFEFWLTACLGGNCSCSCNNFNISCGDFGGWFFVYILKYWTYFWNLYVWINNEIFCFCLLFYVLFVAIKWNEIAIWKQYNVATCYPTTCVYSTTCQRLCYGSNYILYVPTMLQTMCWMNATKLNSKKKNKKQKKFLKNETLKTKNYNPWIQKKIYIQEVSAMEYFFWTLVLVSASFGVGFLLLTYLLILHQTLHYFLSAFYMFLCNSFCCSKPILFDYKLHWSAVEQCQSLIYTNVSNIFFLFSIFFSDIISVSYS